MAENNLRPKKEPLWCHKGPSISTIKKSSKKICAGLKSPIAIFNPYAAYLCISGNPNWKLQGCPGLSQVWNRLSQPSGNPQYNSKHDKTTRKLHPFSDFKIVKHQKRNMIHIGIHIFIPYSNHQWKVSWKMSILSFQGNGSGPWRLEWLDLSPSPRAPTG